MRGDSLAPAASDFEATTASAVHPIDSAVRDLALAATVRADVARVISEGASAQLGAPTQQPGTSYELGAAEQELGRGGLGRVLLVRDPRIGRDIALKELLPELAQAELSAEERALLTERFLREARITAQLEHPSVVPVYELGQRADGSVYYTMRVVRGRTMSAAISAATSLTERLRLVTHFRDVCQAIAYAHSRGVVHRDIKPDNVMLGEFGETVVLDWGIAKRKGDGADARVSTGSDVTLTAVGDVCGTPLYMSPEQVRGESDQVDELSDVWALGALLYNILTGQPPFRARTLPSLFVRIQRERPHRPSRIDPQVPPELAAIALRALNADRRQRYQSARELAADIEAYQLGQRVSAYSYSWFELGRRFVSKHRRVVITVLLAAITVAALTVVAYLRVAAERDRAQAAERSALGSAAEARASLAEALVDKARLASAAGDVLLSRLLAARALELEERPDARGLLIAAGNTLPLSLRHKQPILAGCSSYRASSNNLLCLRDQTLLAVDRAGSELWRLDVAGRLSFLLAAKAATPIALVTNSRTLEVRAGANGALLQRWPIAFDPVQAAISENGHYAAIAASDRRVAVLDLATGATIASTQLPESPTALTFSPDQTQLAIGTNMGWLGSWRFAEREAPKTVDRTAATVLCMAFSSSGSYLAAASSEGNVRVWQLGARALLRSSGRLGAAASSLAWSPDSRFLAVGTKSGAQLFELRLMSRAVRVPGHDDEVSLVSFGGDALHLITASSAAGARSFSISSGAAASRLVDRGNVLALEFLSDGQLVSAGLGENGVAVWDLDNGNPSTRLPVSGSRVRALAVSKDGNQLALAAANSVQVWDTRTRVPKFVLTGHGDEVRGLSYAQSDRALIASSIDGTIELFDAQSGAEIARWSAGAKTQSLAVAPGGTNVAIGQRDGKVGLWSLARRVRVASLDLHATWVMAVAFSPDGHSLASADESGQVVISSVATGTVLARLPGSGSRMTSLAFAPHGRLLAAAGEDRRVRLWRVPEYSLLAELEDHQGTVRVVRFSPDGNWLTSGSDDGTVRLWPMSLVAQRPEAVRAEAAESLGGSLHGTRVRLENAATAD